MSMMRCDGCDRVIDTDDFPDSLYVTGRDCLCEAASLIRAERGTIMKIRMEDRGTVVIFVSEDLESTWFPANTDQDLDKVDRFRVILQKQGNEVMSFDMRNITVH